MIVLASKRALPAWIGVLWYPFESFSETLRKSAANSAPFESKPSSIGLPCKHGARSGQPLEIETDTPDKTETADTHDIADTETIGTMDET